MHRRIWSLQGSIDADQSLGMPVRNAGAPTRSQHVMSPGISLHRECFAETYRAKLILGEPAKVRTGSLKLQQSKICLSLGEETCLGFWPQTQACLAAHSCGKRVRPNLRCSHNALIRAAMKRLRSDVYDDDAWEQIKQRNCFKRYANKDHVFVYTHHHCKVGTTCKRRGHPQWLGSADPYVALT